VLSKAIHDENLQESAIENGGEPDPCIAATINAIGSGNKHSRNRVHLSVLAKTSDMNAQGKRLVDVFEYKSKQIGSIPFDDGFSRLREEHPLTTSPVAPGSGASVGARKGTTRHIPDKPSRILDAPDLMDDYYLNLLHWGPTNTIAVALNQSVYLWHSDTGRIDNLMTLPTPDDYITSVQWSEGNTLAVGTSSSVVQLWDASKLQKIRDLRGHTSRVSSLSWNGATNPHMLSSGARDSSILHHDVRAATNITATLVGHTQEICGLAWSTDGLTLASGGNENRLCIWDLQMSNQGRRSGGGPSQASSSQQNAPRFTIEEHNAAVKAVAWCPWQRHVLASGGGTADRTIRVWNTTSGNCLKSVDTGSQVCAIQWGLNGTSKELVSSHGFSDNQLILWKYSHSTLTKIQEFHGHTSRVLHLARSPDGSTICSASADETIRFWEMFGPSPGYSGSYRGSGAKGSVGAGAARSPKKGPGMSPISSPSKSGLLSSALDRPGGGIR
jgi:cell division cycle protein 20 (cofactor of APC complex)